jgi:CRISPR-associated protein Cmr1
VRDAVRAWLLFGGYGSRTRRGLGSLQPGDATAWLPAQGTRQTFQQLFGRDLFAAPTRDPADTPCLAGAALHVGHPKPDAATAWITALNWLKEFRQGADGRSGGSRWPEAEHVIRLTERPSAEQPGAALAWPRADLGLPIQIQFKGNKPKGGTLTWRHNDDRAFASRLASPLIVKALPLATGTFIPCALWLHRAHPQGRVVLKDVPGSEAPFQSLRSEFFAWLQRRHQTTVVAP